MGIIARILGICRTQPPADSSCWIHRNDRVEIDLARARELVPNGGAIRLEGQGLPERVLVVHGNDGRMYAFHNKCTHAGRRIDPLAGADQVQCCSVGQTTWNYDGQRISGSGQEPLTRFPVEQDGGKLIVRLAR